MKSILLFLFISIISGCSQVQDQINFNFKDQESLSTANFSIIEEDGSILIKFNNDEEEDMIFSKPVKEVKLEVGDTIFIGKPTLKDYSRQVDYKPFIYQVENVQGNIVRMRIRKQDLMFIGFKQDLIEVLKIVKVEKLN
jgi:hypothetical protein